MGVIQNEGVGVICEAERLVLDWVVRGKGGTVSTKYDGLLQFMVLNLDE